MANILALLSGDWNTGTNWTGGVVPGVGDVAVLNGKTMTLPDGGTITCDRVTNSTLLGATSGRLNLTVPAGSSGTYTINADVELAGTSSVDVVQLSTTSVSNKTITVNINGDVLVNQTSTASRTVYINAATSDPCTLNFNLVGDVVCSSTASTTSAVHIAGTYATINYTQTGNVLQTTTTSQYGVRIDANVGIANIAVSGYVQCGYNTSAGLLTISSNNVNNTVVVGLGVRAFGTGYGVYLDNAASCVIGANPSTGLALEPGASLYGALYIGSGVITATINGDVVGGTAVNTKAISTSINASNLKALTINGNVTCNTGTPTKGAIMAGGGLLAITINGDLDMSAFNVSTSSSYVPVNFTALGGAGSKLHVTGDVLGPNSGYAHLPGVQMAMAAVGLALLRVDGTVRGGQSGPAFAGTVATLSTACTQALIHSAEGSAYPPAARPYPAMEYLNFASLDITGELLLSNGVIPLATCQMVRLDQALSVVYKDTTDTPRTASLVNATSVVPSAADVRSGTAVGVTIGTLVVPSAATVLAGVSFDNGTVGTLDVASDIAAIKAKTDQLAFTTGNVHALPTNAADTTAIRAKTDQLAFTLDGVVADSSGVAADYTSRFNSLDTVTAGIKAKTDQLAFTVNGVLADAGAADYTSRFNALDAAVAAIPTITYTTRFNSIDTDLDNLIAGGGVDFTPVLNAVAAVDTHVTGVGSTATAIKAKTDQMTFTVDGIVADVSVSVGNVINYDARFDALDLSSAGIKAKTDQLAFTSGNVNANAVVDTAPIVAAVNTAIGATNTAIANLDADLVTHDTEIKAQLTTIQNATGAIDLTPITTSLATINTNVLNIPTTTYTTRFNTIDSALVAVMSDLADIEAGLGSVGVDLTPVLSAVAGVQADTDALQVAVDSISVDLSPVTSAVAGVQSTANAIKAKTDTITPCDVGALADAIDALEARFAVVPDGPVAIIPQGDSNTTTLFGYCYNQDGSPASGKSVAFYVQQASGHGALLDSAGQVKTSGATGLVTCVVPRGTQYVYAVQFGNRVERINGVDAEILEIPSVIARQ